MIFHHRYYHLLNGIDNPDRSNLILDSVIIILITSIIITIIIIIIIIIIVIVMINLLFDELVADDDGSLDGVGVHDLGRVVQCDVGREVKLLVVDILQQFL